VSEEIITATGSLQILYFLIVPRSLFLQRFAHDLTIRKCLSILSLFTRTKISSKHIYLEFTIEDFLTIRY